MQKYIKEHHQQYKTDAIANQITEKKESKISDATFVALSLDETTHVTNKSQLTTIIRFVFNKGTCSRMIFEFH